MTKQCKTLKWSNSTTLKNTIKITTLSANGFILVPLFFHSLIFLFLKLGSQSQDWLFLF